MPTVSPAQERLMQAAAHTKGGYGGVSQAVGKEFVGKDSASGHGPGVDHLKVWADTRFGSLGPQDPISAPNPERWDVHGDHERKDSALAAMDAEKPKSSEDALKLATKLANQIKDPKLATEFLREAAKAHGFAVKDSTLDDCLAAADALFSRADAMETGLWCADGERKDHRR